MGIYDMIENGVKQPSLPVTGNRSIVDKTYICDPITETVLKLSVFEKLEIDKYDFRLLKISKSL